MQGGSDAGKKKDRADSPAGCSNPVRANESNDEARVVLTAKLIVERHLDEAGNCPDKKEEHSRERGRTGGDKGRPKRWCEGCERGAKLNQHRQAYNIARKRGMSSRV